VENEDMIAVLLGTKFSLGTALREVSPLVGLQPLFPTTMLTKENMWAVLQHYFADLPHLSRQGDGGEDEKSAGADSGEKVESQRQPDQGAEGDENATSRLLEALAELEGRPRFFIKFALESLIELLADEKPADTEGLLRLIQLACEEGRRKAHHSMTTALRSFVESGDEAKALVITLYRSLLYHKGKLWLKMNQGTREAVEAGILAIPVSGDEESGFELDLRAEPALTKALRHIGQDFSSRDICQDVVFGPQTSALWEAEKGIASEIAWAMFLVCSVRSAPQRSVSAFDLLSPVAVSSDLPWWFKCYAFTGSSLQPYSGSDLFAFSYANPTLLLIDCDQMAGADLLGSLEKMDPGALAWLSSDQQETLSSFPNRRPLIIQAKAGKDTLSEAVRTTLPNLQFLGKEGNVLRGRLGYELWAGDHRDELAAAIRVVAGNRSLNRGCHDAISEANKTSASKQSPLVVIKANPQFTGGAIAGNRSCFGKPVKNPLPQPEELRSPRFDRFRFLLPSPFTFTCRCVAQEAAAAAASTARHKAKAKESEADQG
jgi:hypothetical protein